MFACCGHRSLPRQLAVLPYDILPGIICPGYIIRIFGWCCVFLWPFVTSRCVVHHVRHQSSFIVSPHPPDAAPRCSVPYNNNYDRSGPGTLFWNRTRCLLHKKNKTVITTHRAAAAAPTALCMYIKLTCRLLLRHFNHHRWLYIFLHWNIFDTTNKKNHALDSTLRSQVQSDSSLSVRLLIVGSNMMIFQIDVFVYVRMDVWVKWKKMKKAPAVGRRREHGLGRFLRGREGRER